MGKLQDLKEKSRAAAEAIFTTQRYHYRQTFSGAHGTFVLKSLARFTKVNDDLMTDDPVKTAYLLGIRRTMLHITHIMNMSDEEIYNITATKKDAA